VYCEILSVRHHGRGATPVCARGVILSGGPESVTEVEAPRAPQLVFDLKVPVLGIC